MLLPPPSSPSLNPHVVRTRSLSIKFYAGGVSVGRINLATCADCPRAIASKACCGLVLVTMRCAGYYVCNPTTGEILHLPRSHQLHCASGLGFHAPSREFKVVQIISVSQLQATVLTVGDARGWRAPAAAGNQASFVGFTGNAAIGIDEHVQPVLADGCLHWSFEAEYHEKPHEHGIVSFSLADESFRLVPQPLFSTVDGDVDQQRRSQLRPVGKTTLAELDGRLCMMRDLRHRSDVGSLLFEIWKLQDYDTGSWSLDYRVDLTPTGHMAERLKTPCLVVPLRYLDGGGGGGGGSPPAEKRKLLLATTAQEAHIYDPGSGTLRTVASTAVGGDSADEDDEEVKSIRLVLYQESLVRFPGMRKRKRRIGFLQLEQL